MSKNFWMVLSLLFAGVIYFQTYVITNMAYEMKKMDGAAEALFDNVMLQRRVIGKLEEELNATYEGSGSGYRNGQPDYPPQFYVPNGDSLYSGEGYKLERDI